MTIYAVQVSAAYKVFQVGLRATENKRRQATRSFDVDDFELTPHAVRSLKPHQVARSGVTKTQRGACTNLVSATRMDSKRVNQNFPGISHVAIIVVSTAGYIANLGRCNQSMVNIQKKSTAPTDRGVVLTLCVPIWHYCGWICCPDSEPTCRYQGSVVKPCARYNGRECADGQIYPCQPARRGFRSSLRYLRGAIRVDRADKAIRRRLGARFPECRRRLKPVSAVRKTWPR